METAVNTTIIEERRKLKEVLFREKDLLKELMVAVKKPFDKDNKEEVIKGIVEKYYGCNMNSRDIFNAIFKEWWFVNEHSLCFGVGRSLEEMVKSFVLFQGYGETLLTEPTTQVSIDDKIVKMLNDITLTNTGWCRDWLFGEENV